MTNDLDLDYARDIDAVSRDTLGAFLARVEQSTTIEQLVYRELEIDQIWRLLERVAATQGPDAATLVPLVREVEIIHDLIGVDQDTRSAALKLRALIANHLNEGVLHVIR